MTKVKFTICKIVAVNTLALLIVGMFCFGMFMPAAMAAMAGMPQDDGCFHSRLNLQAPLANCCISSNHISTAFINSTYIVNDSGWSLPAVLSDSGLTVADAVNHYSSPREIFPPPESAALRSIVKKE